MYRGYYVPNGMDPTGLYDYECATVITISHTSTARKIIDELYIPECSRYYPISCFNDEFYLPIGETATYGGHEPAGVTTATGDESKDNRSPNDAESLRDYIKEGTNDLAHDKDAWKEAILSVGGAVQTQAASGDCCDCDEMCFYIIFIMTKQEKEYARIYDWYADTIGWGRGMGLVMEDPAIWKDDPVIKFLGIKLMAKRREVSASGYKRCFPCDKGSDSESDY
jgi:hypothetical protein